MTACRALVADPPWRFKDRLPGKRRGAARNYPTLSVEQIKAFPLPSLEADAILFLWRVSSMVEEAYAVARAWGFSPKSEIVWEKTTKSGKPHFGMGRYVRASHETCILATRGRMSHRLRSRSVRSVFKAPVGRHSEKPDAFYALVEQLVDGPFVELFARRERAGWSCFGNEVAVAAPEGGSKC